MTARHIRPPLSCNKCDFEGTAYNTEVKGHHTVVTCPQCGSFIKNLSKVDKYGTKEQQEAIWQKTKGRCYYCGVALNPFKKKEYQYEHIIPRNKGGSNDVENLAPCCQHCNTQKQDKLVSEYRAWIKEKENKKHHIFYFEVVEYGPVKLSEILKKLF